MDDPLLSIELHASTVDLLRALLGALEEMSEGTEPALTADQRSYLVQAMDIAADLDIVFGELADAFGHSTWPNEAYLDLHRLGTIKGPAGRRYHGPQAGAL